MRRKLLKNDDGEETQCQSNHEHLVHEDGHKKYLNVKNENERACLGSMLKSRRLIAIKRIKVFSGDWLEPGLMGTVSDYHTLRPQSVLSGK